jgi:apolipoprotein N-acyltransferase
MHRRSNPYLLALLSAACLNLCFPLNGPVPASRVMFAFFGAVPLLLALLGRTTGRANYLRQSLLLGWLFGVVWYVINCYWIYQTMYLYGGLPAPVAAAVLLLFGILMGLYYALFGLLVGWLRRHSGLLAALVAVPFLWVAIDLLGIVAFRVPWDQLGYSQVGNGLLANLSPWTGVYGVTFLLLVANTLIAAGALAELPRRRMLLAAGVVGAMLLGAGALWQPPPAPTTAHAVLLQENLDVTTDNSWGGSIWDQQVGRYRDEWDVNASRFVQASTQSCTPYIAGMPQTHATTVTPECRSAKTSLVVWPEAPSSFSERDARFQALMRTLTHTTGAAAVVGNAALDNRGTHVDLYNAASVFAADGALVGRYAKVHLVPWGEYIPFQKLFSFAHGLTHNAGRFTHGWSRPVFRLGGQRYGIFICYESIFADEIRQFAQNGAEVLVNISDDGWYGDTSAPWQHLNMARMRAIENRRWVLRDTNTGITAAIDPYGRITQSAPRHIFTALAVDYGVRDDLTFYTRYGDVFALVCGILSLAMLARAARVAIGRSAPRRTEAERSIA